MSSTAINNICHFNESVAYNPMKAERKQKEVIAKFKNKRVPKLIMFDDIEKIKVTNINCPNFIHAVDAMFVNNNHNDNADALKYGIVGKIASDDYSKLHGYKVEPKDKLQELTSEVLRYIHRSMPDNDTERISLTYNMVANLRFKLTGIGHFSNFYEHDDYPSLGFKIGTKVEDSSSAYLAWCREHQGEAGVPLIHSVKKVDSGMFLVVLEKYKKVNKTDVGYKLYKSINNSIYSNNTRIVIKDIIRVELNFGNKDYIEYVKQHKRFIYKYCKTIIAIAKYFKDLAQFDMHDDNWCFDNNGYPVIIDPVSFRRKIIE